MVFELLVLRRLMADERATRHHEVGTGREKGLVDEEVFLLPAKIAADVVNFRIEITRHACRRAVYGVQRAQQRRLVVEAFAGVGYEDGGYA